MADDALFWDVLRQRDTYRNSREAAITRVESDSSRVTMSTGNLSGYFIDADLWREIRALLRTEPRPAEVRSSPETPWCDCGLRPAHLHDEDGVPYDPRARTTPASEVSDA